MRFIGFAVLIAAVLALWFLHPSSGQPRARQRFYGRVVEKVSVRETEATFERIDQLTMSSVSSFVNHPLDLLVDLQGRVVRCRCPREFYARSRVGDEIAVVLRTTAWGSRHCFVPDDR